MDDADAANPGYAPIGDGGVNGPASPVVVSVPHARRDYPVALLDALAVPRPVLTTLEDRYVDVVARAADLPGTTFVQTRARAWIDLNRSEDERDRLVDEGACAVSPGQPSAKVRSGLGLVPRRAGAHDMLWRRRFTAVEVMARIASDHRPYHAALTAALAAARERFGVAVLLDLHSMPPLGKGGAHLVLGDRFGKSAAAHLTHAAHAVAVATGWRCALNAPYAGGHIVERHGRPADDTHAIQLEIDRSLYLDARLDRPGPGLAAVAALVGRIGQALADEALASVSDDGLDRAAE